VEVGAGKGMEKEGEAVGLDGLVCFSDLDNTMGDNNN
jgi:hypothetical protein